MPAIIEAVRPSVSLQEQETQRQTQTDGGLFPIQQHEADIKRLLFESSRVLVVGQTGSGKTTWLPRFMLDVAVQQNPNARIIVTQPKKLAVDNVAERVRSQIGGDLVGYRYKNANTITDKTKIAFMVDGSLVNELLRNKTLEGWDAVMIDEVHEETEDMLLELALIKKAQELRQQQGKRALKLVVTSGTVDVAKIKEYLPGVLVEEVEGRQFEISKNYATHKIEPEDIVPEAVETVGKIFEETDDGDVLVFMPGRSHIKKTISALKTKFEGKTNVSFYEVTGGKQDHQIDINSKAKAGTRRVFVATDVAQTSLTIKGIKDVVISGLKKINTYDVITGFSALRLANATKTDIQQQEGRAGRETKGRAWYLTTKQEYESRQRFAGSAISRADLTRLVLRILETHEDPYTFDFMTKPGKDRIDAAIETLQKLGAVDAQGKITQDIGKQMVEIPTDPHFARMIVEAKKRGVIEPVSILVGFLSGGRSVFAYDPRKENFGQKYARYINQDSDYLTLLNIWNEYAMHFENRGEMRTWAQSAGFSPSVLHEAAATKNEFLNEEIFEDLKLDTSNKPIKIDDATALAIQQSVAAGLVDHVLVNSGDGTYELENGKKRGIVPDRSSVLGEKPAPIITSGTIRAQEKGTYAGMNQKVTREMIDQVAPYLKGIQSLKEAEAAQREAERVAALQNVDKTRQELRQEGLSNNAVSNTTSEVKIEEKLSFVGKLRQTFKNFWGKVKRFFRI